MEGTSRTRRLKLETVGTLSDEQATGHQIASGSDSVDPTLLRQPIGRDSDLA